MGYSYRKEFAPLRSPVFLGDSSHYKPVKNCLPWRYIHPSADLAVQLTVLYLNKFSFYFQFMMKDLYYQSYEDLTEDNQSTPSLDIKVCLILVFFSYSPELQIRGGIEDNTKIIFLISQQKHTL